ncbi:MAG: hypothetical protein SF066_15370 [Thermoanaerobaculia bacterium]|nr:hypothetical protein [Thermoanaerobaculia bacterium]
MGFRSLRGLVFGLWLTATLPVSAASFHVTYPAARSTAPLDGRLLLLLTPNGESEPRFQVAPGAKAIQVVGLDVDAWAPGAVAVVDGSAFGYPVASLADVPAGEYWVQAVLHKYETFHRADGHVVKLPMDRGEGQHWNLAPGNLYSTPRKVSFDPARAEALTVILDQEIPPIPKPADTPWVKHIEIESPRLTQFWGRPMKLGAHVLLPAGFAEHPNARYPLMIFHGHFPADFGGWRTEPPDPNLAPDWSERFKISGYNRIQQEEAYAFYQKWQSPGFPRFLAIEIQHANPYYDDSYAVNSENLGPYGDAITYELIPEIERRFRGIGQGWARFLYGGSTGGWEALAAQIFYPDEYNGAFGACPDPIDFRAYMTVNLYENDNAYFDQGPFTRTYRPGHRDYLGHIQATVQDDNHLELALGTKSRSGEQFDIWEAVYSPVGPDGYPVRIFDKKTGVIDKKVAAHWRENYDLRHILERDWSKLGSKLAGKLHIYCGDMDNYYLNNAVYLMEAFLESTKNPYYDGEVAYGDRAEHCWNGDPNNPNYLTRLRYHTMYLDRILKRIEKSAPAGADVTSWRY